MWATIILIGTLPPPSAETLAKYAVAAKPVYPRYVFRVWSADW